MLIFATCVQCGRSYEYGTADEPGFYQRVRGEAEAAGWRLRPEGSYCPAHAPVEAPTDSTAVAHP